MKHTYEEASRQIINYHKYKIFYIHNTTQQDREAIGSVFNVHKVLGTSIHDSLEQKDNFQLHQENSLEKDNEQEQFKCISKAG